LFAWARFLAPALKGLLTDHCTAITFHSGIVCGEELRCDHALDLIFRADSNECRYGGAVLAISRVFIGILHPKRLNRLVRENVVPVVGLRSANALQLALMIFGIIGQYRYALFIGGRFTAVHRATFLAQCPLHLVPGPFLCFKLKSSRSLSRRPGRAFIEASGFPHNHGTE
jgi:hypothetical protein